MYRCRDCETIFNKVEPIPDGEGAVMNTCPGCNSTDYEEVTKCSNCGRYKFDEDLYEGICFDCAKAEYNVRRGNQFINKNREDFFLTYWKIRTLDKNITPDEKEKLIATLESEFYNNIIFDDDSNYISADKEEAIKNYCLKDIESWIEFLKEEIL